MWNPIRAILWSSLVILVVACDPNPVKVETYTGNEVLYSIYTKELNFIGQMNMKEYGDGGIEINVKLDEEAPGDIRLSFTDGGFLEPGDEIMVIGSVKAGSLISQFEIQPKEMKYHEMGALNSHVRMTHNGEFFAATEVGQQAFNGVISTYIMENFNPAFTGGVEILKRYNGGALIKINIGATENGAVHPAHIHVNTYAEGGEILINLSDVTGEFGIGVTEIKEDIAGNPVKYEDLVNLNAHIRVHSSTDNLQEIIAYGDIGINGPG